MLKSRLAAAAAAFTLAAALSVGAAILVAHTLESRSLATAERVIRAQAINWARVTVNGLQVTISGQAPDVAGRFRVLNALAKVVDRGRLRDNMTVREASALPPPQFALEILRNGDGISLIGLVPRTTGRAELLHEIAAAAGNTPVTDMLGEADNTAPRGWRAALAFAIHATGLLPRSKISVTASKITVTAVTDSPAAKKRFTAMLTRMAPQGPQLVLHVNAPRPIIAPFTLRFLIDGSGPRFDACAADTEKARAEILAAAAKAGLGKAVPCTLGLGVPSPRWAEAVRAGIATISRLGGGSVTFSDADVTLVAPMGTEQARFEQISGDLRAQLPEVFSLHAVLPKAPPAAGGVASRAVPEFTATLSGKNRLELRGRLADARQAHVVASFARARFADRKVTLATRPDPMLPQNWPVRVLAGLDALAVLHDGTLTVTPDQVSLSGVAAYEDASANASRILAAELGALADFRINVRFDRALVPVVNIPTPAECVAALNAALARHKITFQPSSASIDASAANTLSRIARIMAGCTDVKMDVDGFTDSQGRATMNLALSQSRAEAVIDALLARGVLTSNLTAKGFGESQPIADNKTAAGREKNRRIEFHLPGAIAPQADAAASTQAPKTINAANGGPKIVIVKPSPALRKAGQ